MSRLTNVEIVAFQWAQLVAAGMISESEEIHTFQKWKSLGYAVRKGEKAIASFTIWKHTTKTDKESGEESAAMFMKKAHFFSTSQVEKITPVKRVSAAEMVGKKVTIKIGR